MAGLLILNGGMATRFGGGQGAVEVADGIVFGLSSECSARQSTCGRSTAHHHLDE